MQNNGYLKIAKYFIAISIDQRYFIKKDGSVRYTHIKLTRAKGYFSI